MKTTSKMKHDIKKDDYRREKNQNKQGLSKDFVETPPAL